VRNFHSPPRFRGPFLMVRLPDEPLVEIDIRAVKRLRESADARATIAPMVEALFLQLGRTRIAARAA
jgi:hypothetical protein